MSEFKKGEFVDIVDKVICDGGKPIRGVVEDYIDIMKSSQFPVRSKGLAYRVKVKEDGYVVNYWLTSDRLRKVSA